ncbi:hypothetical protein HYR99_41360 [Candidatus Poribacteria bacterium]|nr:hypothetical protein [Candidatus Poribacteria bacterium]
MKEIAILGLLLLSPAAFGELTKEEVRTILKEEITASEARMREFIDLKLQATNTEIKATNTRIDELDKRLGNIFALVIALIALITAAIAVPQIIMAFREKGQSKLEAQIEQLRQKVEILEQSRILR